MTNLDILRKIYAKQINVYVQIIELTVQFDNIGFVTAIVVVYFD